MSDSEEHCDSECQERGIPPHLHQVERQEDPEFDPSELLYRRAQSPEVEPTAAINFKRMSVNRQKYCESPEDVLWNDKEGGKYPDQAIICLPVAALSQVVEHPEEPYSFGLKPIHKPEQCNYPHTEVTALKIMEDGSEETLAEIRPKSIKLRMRTELAEYLEVYRPSNS